MKLDQSGTTFTFRTVYELGAVFVYSYSYRGVFLRDTSVHFGSGMNYDAGTDSKPSLDTMGRVAWPA
eukprot:6986590-Prymnesium_polylepis.1